jgi:predicted transcriptional regulator
MEENVPTVDPEELVSMYEQRMQEQTAIMFALIGKLGGSVVLTKEDLTSFGEFNTVHASNVEDDGLKLELIYEDR